MTEPDWDTMSKTVYAKVIDATFTWPSPWAQHARGIDDYMLVCAESVLYLTEQDALNALYKQAVMSLERAVRWLGEIDCYATVHGFDRSNMSNYHIDRIDKKVSVSGPC